MKYLLTALFLSMVLTSCSKFCKEVPPVQDFIVVDPDPIPVFNARPVEVEVWNQSKLAEEAAKPENKDKVFFVFTREQFSTLLDNMNVVSDVLAKSIETNQYWQKSVNDYRGKKETK